MDPVSLIIAALAAGAAAAAKDTADSAVKDMYAALRALIRRRFGHDLEVGGERPERLTERLRAADVESDAEVVKAAQALLRQIDPGGASAGKYDVSITGGKGIVVGDHATTTMNFGDDA